MLYKTFIIVGLLDAIFLLTNKIARFGEREGLTPSIIAEAIVAKTPEQTMENFSKVIENWDKAKAMGMSADTFELNHCQTIKGVEFER